MTRLLVRIGALVVLGLLVCIPTINFATTSSTLEETSISDYRADFVIHENGDLDAVETITVDFPIGSSKHGIFRFSTPTTRPTSTYVGSPRASP